MSFWKSLLGGGVSEGRQQARTTAKAVDYNGYRIEAQPYQEAGQYQLAGTITKTIDGVEKSHRYVRADRFTSAEDAAEMAIMKGRQIIDQQGDRIFG